MTSVKWRQLESSRVPPRLLALVGVTLMLDSQYQRPPLAGGRSHVSWHLAGPVTQPLQSCSSSHCRNRWQVEANTEHNTGVKCVLQAW